MHPKMSEDSATSDLEEDTSPSLPSNLQLSASTNSDVELSSPMPMQASLSESEAVTPK